MSAPSAFPIPVRLDRYPCDAAPVWDPTSTQIAVMNTDGLSLYDLERREVRATFQVPPVRVLAWSPGGETLLCALEDARGGMTALDAGGGPARWHASLPELEELRFSPDGRRCACLGDDVIVIDVSTGETLWRYALARHPDRVDRGLGLEGASFLQRGYDPVDAWWSPDGSLLAVAWGDGRFSVLAGGKVAAEAQLDGLGCIRWSASGRTLYESGTNRLGWFRFAIDAPFTCSFTASLDGTRMAAEGSEHVLHILEEGGVRSFEGHPRTITGLAWSSRGVLVTACRDEIIRLWSSEHPTIEVVGADLGNASGNTSFSTTLWSPDGSRLLVTFRGALVALSWADDAMLR